MPMPRPINSQFDRSLSPAAARRGNQASGAAICWPSSRSTMSVSSPKLTCRARPLSVSRPGTPGLSSEVLMPCLLHHRTPRGHDLEHDAYLARAAIMRFGKRDWWPKPDLRVCGAGPGMNVRRLVAFVAPEEKSEATLAVDRRHRRHRLLA